MHKLAAALFAIAAIAAPTFAHAACKGGCNQPQITTPVHATTDTSSRSSSTKGGKLEFLKITMKQVTVSGVQ